MNGQRIVGETLRAIVVVVAVSVLIWAAERVSHVSNISNLYIIAIAVLAAKRGMYPAVAASVLAFLVFDWLFVAPAHDLVPQDPSEYVALLTLLVTAIVIGQLLAVARAKADQVRRSQRHTQLLYEVGQAALSNPHVSAVYPLALSRLNETVGLVGSRILVSDGGSLREAGVSGTVFNYVDEKLLLERVVGDVQSLAVWQQRSGVRIVGELTIPAAEVVSPEDSHLSQTYLPVQVDSRVEGILVVGEKRDGSVFSAEERLLLLAFGSQLAIAAKRESFAAQEARAQALEESDHLKSALVSSVSHELKTPLAAIKASVTTLLEEEGNTSAEVRRELAESVNRETDRLTQLVGNLLDMSRIEGGALRPHLERTSIVDVVADVLDRMEPVLAGRSVTVDVPETLPAVPMDFVQISQVLTNLLDNAARYSEPEAAIAVSAGLEGDELRVAVLNEGSEIPPRDLERVFEKFYRASAAPGGIGLGLAIARAIVDAHRGRIWAENVGQRGVVFTFRLPSRSIDLPMSGATGSPASAPDSAKAAGGR